MTRSTIPSLGGSLAALAFGVLILTATPAFAGGYIVSEVDSAASGRGNAASALTDSPSAVYYNPANLTKVEGLQIRLGAAMILPRWGFDDPDPDLRGGDDAAKSRNNPAWPPNLSLSYNLGDPGIGTVAVGFGVYVPYGSGFKWPRRWRGQAELRELALTVLEISPAIAWAPSKYFSVGGSLRVLPASVYLRRAVLFPGVPEGGEFEGGGGSVGVGAGLGLSIFPTESISIAFTARTPVTLELTGDANFDFPVPFDTVAADGPIRTELPLPTILRVGTAVDVLPGTLNISADFQVQLWDVYTSLDIIFENPDGTETIQSAARNAHNSVVASFGAEFTVFEGLDLRAGYSYDQGILPDNTINPSPPDSDKHLVNLGASYVWDGWLGFHAHTTLAFFGPRASDTTPFPAYYTGGHGADIVAFVAGLTASVKFDVAPVFGGGEAPTAQVSP